MKKLLILAPTIALLAVVLFAAINDRPEPAQPFVYDCDTRDNEIVMMWVENCISGGYSDLSCELRSRELFCEKRPYKWNRL
jgi:hypothetical protein